MKSANSYLTFFATITIGGMGAIGQAYLLYHELFDRYPYKVMSFPPASFYQSVAFYGAFLAPGAAILVGLVAGLKRNWLCTIVPVVFCPFVFACVFETALLIRKASGVVDSGRNFDGTSAEVVAQGFLNYCLALGVAGLVIGAICKVGLSVWQTRFLD